MQRAPQFSTALLGVSGKSTGVSHNKTSEVYFNINYHLPSENIIKPSVLAATAALAPAETKMDNGTQEQDIVLDLESDDVGVSLPNAEEMKLDAVTMSKGREAKAKAFKLYGILFACVLALIIGLAVGLSDKKPDNASGVAATAPTGGDGSGSVATGDDTSPTVTVNTNGFDGAGSLERYQKTFHILKEISEETVLSKQFTPQNKAANWIANIDEKELDVPTTLAGTASYSFVQRYVLALLYYEWEGSDWTFGSKFLTNNDECDWNIGFQTDAKHSYKFGASCAGEDQRISQIFMRKCPFTIIAATASPLLRLLTLHSFNSW